ncbi:SDR family oxidoreductase [Streptomyces sp. NPDC093228]|uniref:SDR family oxidoreductase n=1 Tax=Streptomyces sp. NPDC093228 TaxID=3155070 RepID=UPI003434497A
MPSQNAAFVTGVSSGFGRLIAEELRSRGWAVYGSARDIQGRNAQAVQEIQAAGIGVVELDVTDTTSVNAAAEKVLSAAGAVDLLVNNAGAGYFGVAEAFTPEDMARQFDSNVLGPLRVNRAFLPTMRSRHSGLIVYVTSTLGRSVVPFGGLYAASKWALEALAEASSYELRPFHVDVAIIEAGTYPTDLFSKFTGPSDTERSAEYSDVLKYVGTLDTAFAREAEGRDVGEIARAVADIADMPAGRRPLRIPVPESPVIEETNQLLAAYQEQLFTKYGLESLLRE